MALCLVLVNKDSMPSGRKVEFGNRIDRTNVQEKRHMRSHSFHFLLELLLMLVLSGLMYLPFVSQFGYYNDDWYSMYAARVAGTDVFHEMYSIDRPGRAYVMIPLYQLFQGNPFYYNISAYMLRVLGALCLLWLLRLLWPDQNQPTLLATLLFLIYPGFLSMPNAIDFQSHLVGIVLAFASLGLSVAAFYQTRGANGAALWLGAVLSGWAYLSQMEYYIGFEAVRLLLIGLLVYRNTSAGRTDLGKVFRHWLPYSIVPLVYLLWRIFFFDNERVTTDVGIQLGMLISTPLTTLYQWIGSFIQSILNVTLLAWGVPLTQLGFNLDPSNSMRAILIALIVTVVALAAFRSWKFGVSGEGSVERDWTREMLLVGLAWTVLGLIAVIMGNRIVTFPVYSRYGLVSAAGAILALVPVLSYVSEKRIRLALLGFLFFSATLTHYGNGHLHAQFTKNMRTFWWQAAWRVPQLGQGSTLIVNYPDSGIREDSFVWGPANHIYYPYRIKPDSVLAGVYAILLDHEAVIKIQNRERQVYRKHIIVDTYRNYRNFVILTQPSPQSCLHVIDGERPEYSRFENDAIMLIGEHSEIEHILTNEEFKTPPQFLFGPEPPHSWCYFYAKADLGRQRGDWDAVLAIGEQAFALGLEPADLIEWMPFLQAYVHTDDSENLEELAPLIANDAFVAAQACQNLKLVPSISPQVETIIDENYCISQ